MAELLLMQPTQPSHRLQCATSRRLQAIERMVEELMDNQNRSALNNTALRTLRKPPNQEMLRSEQAADEWPQAEEARSSSKSKSKREVEDSREVGIGDEMTRRDLPSRFRTAVRE
ncbi:hypothetical protein PRZ48_004718 [Zasmidium cellare]|uniref:Uncharacterized protein n=1 Tax=Zasmidium cellare TaxID=395010 RepID=A0ABR0ERS2_ZASCE|nr:hypothetical protein PRZ48_004718 [Zasmidium cellare]